MTSGLMDPILPAGGDTAKPRNLRKRIHFLKRYLDFPGLRLLDGGCGEGEYVLALRELGVEAIGIEYDKEKVARHLAAHPGSDYVQCGDLEHLPFADASFDAVLLNEVLEHVPNEDAGLQEARRVLRPGGRLILFSPNRLYPFESHGMIWRANGYKVPHWVPFLPYLPSRIKRIFLQNWARNYWPGELRQLVRTAGFHILDFGFVWQTLENISGHQPRFIRAFVPALRLTFDVLERTAFLRAFGCSQVIVAEKPDNQM